MADAIDSLPFGALNLNGDDDDDSLSFDKLMSADNDDDAVTLRNGGGDWVDAFGEKTKAEGEVLNFRCQKTKRLCTGFSLAELEWLTKADGSWCTDDLGSDVDTEHISECGRLEVELRPHRIEFPSGGPEHLIVAQRQFTLEAWLEASEGGAAAGGEQMLEVTVVFDDDGREVSESSAAPPLIGETREPLRDGKATFKLRLACLSHHYSRRLFRLVVRPSPPTVTVSASASPPRQPALRALSVPFRSVAKLPPPEGWASKKTAVPAARAAAPLGPTVCPAGKRSEREAPCEPKSAAEDDRGGGWPFAFFEKPNAEKPPPPLSPPECRVRSLSSSSSGSSSCASSSCASCPPPSCPPPSCPSASPTLAAAPPAVTVVPTLPGRVMRPVMTVKEEAMPFLDEGEEGGAELDGLGFVQHNLEDMRVDAATRAAWRQQVARQLSSNGEQLALLLQQQEQILKALGSLTSQP